LKTVPSFDEKIAKTSAKCFKFRLKLSKIALHIRQAQIWLVFLA